MRSLLGLPKRLLARRLKNEKEEEMQGKQVWIFGFTFLSMALGLAIWIAMFLMGKQEPSGVWTYAINSHGTIRYGIPMLMYVSNTCVALGGFGVVTGMLLISVEKQPQGTRRSSDRPGKTRRP